MTGKAVKALRVGYEQQYVTVTKLLVEGTDQISNINHRLDELAAQAAAAPAASQPKVIAPDPTAPLTLSNGVKIQITAIGTDFRPPSDSKLNTYIGWDQGKPGRWWKADGTPLNEPPVQVIKVNDLVNHRGFWPASRPEDLTQIPYNDLPKSFYLLIVLTSYTLPEDVSVWQCGTKYDPEPRFDDFATTRDKQGKSGSAAVIAFADMPEEANVSFTTAVGPWEQVAVFDGEKTKDLVNGVMVTCGPPHADNPQDGSWGFDVMHNIDRDKYALRMIAHLKNGKEEHVVFHGGIRTGNPAKGFSAIFPAEYKPFDVKEYRLERTPWAHGVIKNVALKPKPATQPAVLPATAPATEP